jgi:hypothetical protein
MDAEVEKNAVEINKILKMPLPYGSIQSLPELVDRFSSAYAAVLEGMAKPVYEVIEDARMQVMHTLEDKEYKDEMLTGIINKFLDLKTKAEGCKNIADLQTIKLEADTVKMRLLEDIA